MQEEPQRGLFITMEQMIADGIDRLVPPKPLYDTFGRKVNRLKAKMKNVTGNRNWDLFVAAVEFVLASRDRSSHPNVTSSFDDRMESYKKFKSDAFKYGLDLPSAKHGCPHNPDKPDEPDNQDRHVGRKTWLVLARMARAWLDECDRDMWK